MTTNLRSWLRRNPQPHSVRYTTSDDEERELQLSTSARNKWKDAAEALEEVGAVRVECIASDGKVLRVTTLAGDEDDDTGAAKGDDKRSAREMAGLATVLDAHGKRMNEAFEKGSEAASRGQDNLVDVVQILTHQWTATMAAVHQLSMQLGKVLRAQSGADEEHDELAGPLQQVLGMAAMRMMNGGAAQAGGGDAKPKPEGKKGA